MSEGETSPTSSTLARSALGHRPELDGLRGVAVAMVVVYHVGVMLWPSAPNGLLPGGALGVDLFFVLSGFLITSLLLGEHARRGAVDLPAFARRRVVRLVPGLVALFAVVLAVAAATTQYQVRQVVSSAAWSLSFTANWAVLEGSPHVLGHLWSLSVEGQFYLVWAVALVVALRFRHAAAVLAAGAVVAIVAVAVWRYGQVESGVNLFLLYLSTQARFDAPMVGALAGIALATGRLDWLRGRVASGLAVAGLMVVLASAALVDPLAPALHRGLFTLVALGAACAVVGAVQAGGGPVTGVLAGGALMTLGRVSYSLYLWHHPVFDWLADATPGWPPVLRTVVGVSAAVAAAAASYRFVERPFIERYRGVRTVPSETQAPVAMAKQRSSSSPKAYSS
jgi:peptidoglycan/LPS O-acetylase OafA/YrhL